MGTKRERKDLLLFLESLIEARVAWASSPEGRKALGPGSPTVPGLQDLYAVRRFVELRELKSSRKTKNEPAL